MVENEENMKTRIVDNNHKLLGKHVISSTVPLALKGTSKTAELFNSMPGTVTRKCAL